MQLTLAICQVRSWRATDAQSLAAHANNRRVWINLRDGFPHPYGLADARAFIKSAQKRVPETNFAIVVENVAVGGIGFRLHDDVERVAAEIGYWLGEAYWGRGIMTQALAAVTGYAMREHDLTRLYAVPFAWNDASVRVLEKAGYVCEGRMRRSAIKDGQVVDQLLYAYTDESDPGKGASAPRARERVERRGEADARSDSQAPRGPRRGTSLHFMGAAPGEAPELPRRRGRTVVDSTS
jgi:RimJ/RimL family protein N-acetyltransferase